MGLSMLRRPREVRGHFLKRLVPEALTVRDERPGEVRRLRRGVVGGKNLLEKRLCGVDLTLTPGGERQPVHVRLLLQVEHHRRDLTGPATYSENAMSLHQNGRPR